jgi:hypothetical protein
VNAREWTDAFAAQLGVPAPTREEFSILLEVAGEAAHSSERVAAPVACWLTARAGVDPARALELAREVGDG